MQQACKSLSLSSASSQILQVWALDVAGEAKLLLVIGSKCACQRLVVGKL